MRKRLLVVLMIVGVMVGTVLTGCAAAPGSGSGGGGGGGGVVEWTLDTYFSPPPGIWCSRVVESFTNRVNQRLEGRLKINAVYGSSLGVPGPDVAVALNQGVFQADFTALPYLAGDIPVLGIAGLPGLLPDNYHALMAHSVLAPYYASELESRGVLLIGNPQLFPKQGMWSKKPIRTLQDIKGLRLRVSSPEQTMMANALGAIPVSLNMPEVYQALERGMLDAILGSTATAMSVSAWEVLDYGTDMAFTAADWGFLVSKKAWDELPADIQLALMEEALATSNESNRRSLIEEANDWATLSSKGMEKIVPDPQLPDELAGLCAPVWDSWAQSRGGVAAQALAEVRALLGR